MAENNNVNSASKQKLSGFADDFRQSFVVAKNEINKFFHGKKMFLFAAITAFVLVIVAIVFAVYVEDPQPNNICGIYASFAYLLILMAATLFSATSIASEYEERTALILFVRPVRRSSIYFGKFLASVIVITAYMIVYYVIAALVSIVLGGSVPGNFWVSLCLSLCYMIAAVGIALLLSSFFKKSSTASIMTFITLLLIISLITSMLILAGLDGAYETWFMLDTAANDIYSSISGVVSTYDVDAGTYVDTEVQPFRSAAVMIVWGIAGWIAGYILFKRREF